MSRIEWDKLEERTFETGVDHGVLYPVEDGKYPKGYAWNGLVTVSENPSGAEVTKIYADNINYLNMMSAEELSLSIECYTYPDQWKECDGSAEVAEGISVTQQKRRNFGLSYRTKVGNAVSGQDFGYKLHLIYGGMAAPSERSHGTINESVEAMTFSYEVSTTPINMPGNLKPASLIEIDSTKADKVKLEKLENILYGTDEEEARLPLPDEIFEIFSED